jgi:hypothetical protein
MLLSRDSIDDSDAAGVALSEMPSDRKPKPLSRLQVALVLI